VNRRTFQWASAFATAPGEQLCGDACLVTGDDRGLLLALIDASGHGPAAHEVAQKIVSLLRARAGDLALLDFLTEAHVMLRGGRGAAISMLSLDPSQGRAEFAGVGNVACRSLGPSRFGGVPNDGIVGRSMGRLRLHQGTVEPGDLLVLHTDGIKATFPMEPLRLLSAQQAADGIVSHYGRGVDDAACMVVKVSDG
jgi:phosphoserine phosphatase RsbX